MKAHYETINGVQTSIEEIGDVVKVTFGGLTVTRDTFAEGEEWIKKHVKFTELFNSSDIF